MPHELQKQIENHLATFPDRYNDVQEMKKEWAEYKTKAMYVLLGFSGSVLAIGIWVGTLQTNIENINQEHSKLELNTQQIEARVNLLEVTNGEIKARLTSIDLMLQEIKLAINQLK